MYARVHVRTCVMCVCACVRIHAILIMVLAVILCAMIISNSQYFLNLDKEISNEILKNTGVYNALL